MSVGYIHCDANPVLYELLHTPNSSSEIRAHFPMDCCLQLLVEGGVAGDGGSGAWP